MAKTIPVHVTLGEFDMEALVRRVIADLVPELHAEIHRLRDGMTAIADLYEAEAQQALRRAAGMGVSDNARQRLLGAAQVWNDGATQLRALLAGPSTQEATNVAHD